MPRRPQSASSSSGPPWSGGPQIDMLAGTLDEFLHGHRQLIDAEARFRSLLPVDHQAEVDAILSASSKSYPPGLLIQLAYALAAHQKLDVRVRHEGARGITGVSGKLGSYLAARHM